ncbi:MAG: aldose epimerase family protein [Prevotellaceae bacterium]|nr:aldose epimerase family protein [Prevotellaceae bacterium]
MKKLSTIILLFWATASFAQNIPFISAAPYDTVINAKKVSLYTITNGRVAAQVTNYGGFIVSLFAPDRDDNYANLVTSYPTISQYTRYNIGMVGPAVGRYANRIANGCFTLNGNTYQLTLNNGKHTLHSGNNGFDHTVWDVVKSSADELVLKCVSPDGTDGFPGTLTTTLTYSITADNGLRVEYNATTDAPTVVSTTTHSYFNLNGAGNGDVMNHRLMVKAKTMTETDREGIPSGKILKVKGTLYDFNKATRIGDRQMDMKGFRFGQKFEMPKDKVFAYDNNFCVSHKKAGSLDKVATLYAPESGRMMEVWNNHPGLQIYTGARRAIALESQMYPDSPNHPEFPSATLNPGETYNHVCIYKFTTK